MSTKPCQHNIWLAVQTNIILDFHRNESRNQHKIFPITTEKSASDSDAAMHYTTAHTKKRTRTVRTTDAHQL